MYLGKQNYRMVNMSTQLPHNYISTVDPTIDVNPPIINMTWLNSSSGEVFVCADNTIGSNRWVGSTSLGIIGVSFTNSVFSSGSIQDNILYDSSGNNLNGVIQDATQDEIRGRFPSLYFNGSPLTGVTCSDSGFTTGTSWSFFSWVKLYSYNDIQSDILTIGDPDNAWSGLIISSEGYLRGAFDDGVSPVWPSSTTSVPLNEWHFLGAVYSREDDYCYFYYDGQLVPTTSAGDLSGISSIASTWGVKIGHRSKTTDRAIGLIGESFVYNSTISEEQALLLYELTV